MDFLQASENTKHQCESSHQVHQTQCFWHRSPNLSYLLKDFLIGLGVYMTASRG